jgi:hypothetical protein
MLRGRRLSVAVRARVDRRGVQVIPKRARLSRRRGGRLPAGAVRVDRTTRWGNPFRADPGREREAVARFRTALLAGSLQISEDDVRRELRGKVLACWCPPELPCHADVLIEVANG